MNNIKNKYINMLNSISQNNIAQAITYIKPKFPEKIWLKQEFLNKLKNDITLQIQGEPVEVSESDDLAGLLLALNIAYKFCPELVLKTKLENKYLIFDHQAKPVLRDSEIIEGLSLKADNKKKKVKTLKIDIEKIWNVIKEKDEVKRIKKCLKEVEKKLKPAEKVILIGRKQALVFLLVQYCLYGLAEEIWYKKSEKSKNIKIK